MHKLFFKDPNAVKDIAIDWTRWLTLTPSGTADTISSSTWTVDSGITKDSDSSSTTLTTIWLSGGTAGTTYDLTNRIVTAGGRTEDRTISVRVRNE